MSRSKSAGPEALVTANHVLVRQGVLDAFGHVSARTGPREHMFLLSRSLAPSSVTTDDLLVHDFDGQVTDERAPYLERFIHTEIYRQRPDVMAIVHSHSPAVLPFCVSEIALRPVFHMAGFLPSAGLPVFEIRDVVGNGSDLLVSSPPLGEAAATVLGEGPAALMRGHGYVAVGASLPEACFRAVYLQVNARVQLEALRLGEPRYLSSDEADAAAASARSQEMRAWNVWHEEIDRASVRTSR